MTRYFAALILCILANCPSLHAQSAVSTASDSASNTERGYFFNYWETLKRDLHRVKDTCATAKLAQTSGATPYQKLNHWVACGQLPFSGDALALGLGQAPPDNGFGIGITTKDDQALDSGVAKPGINSEWDLHGDISWYGSWTSYFLWTLKPAWSSREFRAPAFRVFAGGQSIPRLPYFGEGGRTSPNNQVNYALQRTALGEMADTTLKRRPLNTNTVLHLLAGGEWYGLNDGPAPGLSTLPTRGALSAAPSYFQQAVGLDTTKPAYKTGSALQQSDAIHGWFTNRHSLSGQYSFRQWSASIDHTISVECVFCPSMELSGNMTETITDAGQHLPFFLEPTIGGSDINNAVTLPGYADYRFRAPNAEAVYALVQEPLIVKGAAWPIDFVARADSGKVALTRGDLALDHMRHSFAAGLGFRVGDTAVISILFAWSPEGGHYPIVKVNPNLFGRGVTNFW